MRKKIAMVGRYFFHIMIVSCLFISVCSAGLSTAFADAGEGMSGSALSTDNCTATLSNDLLLNVPILTFYGFPIWAVFQSVPDTAEIALTNYGSPVDPTVFSGCQPSILSPDLILHVPDIVFDGLSYLADFQYSHDLSFSLIGAGLNTDSTLYQLSADSTYQEGCVAPCMCPVSIARGISGTFKLIPLNPVAFYNRYSLDEIYWTVINPDGTVAHTITGFGTYQIGGEFALMNQLVLELSIDNSDLMHFDSGLVVDGAQFPVISIPVDRGTACYDIMMYINAAPAQ